MSRLGGTWPIVRILGGPARLSLLSVIALSAGTPVHAQQDSGHIYGRVFDQTGGALPGATVTLTGQLIGTMAETTDLLGNFRYLRLSPGLYDLLCELDGFTTHVRNGMYQLPYGVNVAANLMSREGFPVMYCRVLFFVDPGSSTKAVRTNVAGERRYPNMVELDTRISKSISLADRGIINLDLDVFNALNRNTPLNVLQRAFSATDPRRSLTGQVTDLLYPRTVRLGLRYSF
ncbi:MAG: carboxypeptidase regulatory-like domain-containing protein [Acidobacteria bacterium]|nr:carboxypeptidase regulatory-like domain-containing protein [Acidobacteriota bacterium]